MTPVDSLRRVVAVLPLLFAAAPAWGAPVRTLDDIEFWVGSGANRAALAVDWDNPDLTGDGERGPLAWGYRWDGTATGQGMFEAIAAADPRLVLQTEFFPQFGTSALFGIGYDRDADGFSETDPDDSYRFLPFGDPSAETWSYFTAAGSPFDGSGAWAAAGEGFGSRALSDGAWDGWRVTFDPFSVPGATLAGPRPLVAAPAAVPEPATGGLVLLAAAAAGGVARRRRDARCGRRGLGRGATGV